MGLIRSFKWLIAPTSFTILKSSANIKVWATYLIPYYLSPTNTTNQKIHWTSSNTNVATVDEYWVVTTISAGNCTITWRTDYLSLTDTIDLTTYVVNVTGITLNKDKINISAWKSVQLEATITPEDASNKQVTWYSSNTSVATVSQDWLVTYVWDWDCTITATTVDWWYTATCEVKTKWSPWDDTIAYFPFREDFADHKWSRTLTVNDCSINNGSAKINSQSSYMNLSSTIWWSDITINVWYYYWALSTWWWWNTLFARTWWTYHHFLLPATTSDWKTIWQAGFYNSAWYPWSKVLEVWHRYNIIIVKSWTNQKIYINGELIEDSNSSFDNNSWPVWTIANYNSWQSQWAQGRMSELIFENKLWTQEEATDYFNSSKSEYWYDISCYQEIEYIQSSWTQYIDTQVKVDTTAKMDTLEAYIKATHTWSWNFLWTKSASSWTITYMTMEVVSSATTTLRCFIWNTSTYTDRAILHNDNTTTDEITYNYSSSLATFIVNWTTYTQSRSSWYNTGSHPIYIFCRNNWADATEQLLSMKLYSCYIKIWWEKVRDFMPCYRKEDWMIWLRDKVEWKFYINKWSWAFTAWPKIWISLDKNKLFLQTVWETYQLTVTTIPSSIAQWWFVWSSSDNSIATVSNSWLVTCVTPGECTITCISNTWWYIDTCEVMPKKPDYDMYYDFRGWSLAWFQAAWWTWIYTDWSYTIDSWWLWQTGSSNDRNTHAYVTWLDFTDAKFAYIERLWYWYSGSRSNWKWMWYWTSYNWANWFNWPWIWWRINLNTSSPETYSTNGINYYPNDPVTSYQKYAASWWETTEHLEIDFVNNVCKYVLTWANNKTFTINLTEELKNNLFGMTWVWWNWWRWYSSYNSERIRRVKIHIEY